MSSEAVARSRPKSPCRTTSLSRVSAGVTGSRRTVIWRCSASPRIFAPPPINRSSSMIWISRSRNDRRTASRISANGALKVRYMAPLTVRSTPAFATPPAALPITLVPIAGSASAAQPEAVMASTTSARTRTCTLDEACKHGAAKRSGGGPAVAGDAAKGRDVGPKRRQLLAIAQVARDDVPDRLTTGRTRLLGDRCPARDAIRPPRVQRRAAEPQIRDAPAGARRRIARVGQAAHPHHVAALLVIRVRVEEVVTDVLEQRLQGLARHVSQRRLRIRERRLAHHVFHGDRLPGQQRAAPAEARRQRDLRPLHRHERVEQHLVPRAVEVAAPV